MDGLHVRFARQDVVGVKLGASPPSTPSFEAWDGAVFHFGRTVDSGTVSVTASTTLDATAGQSVMVDAETVTLSSGSTVDVTSAEVVKVQSATVDVQAVTAMAVASEFVSLASASVDVVSSAEISVSSGAVLLEGRGDMGLSSGEVLSVLATSMEVGVENVLEVSSEGLTARAGSRMSAFSASSVSLETANVQVDLGSEGSVFAGEAASLVTARAFVEASDILVVHTNYVDMTMTGDVALQSAEQVTLSGAAVSATAADAMRVGASRSVSANVGADTKIGVGGHTERTAWRGCRRGHYPCTHSTWRWAGSYLGR